MPRVLHISKTPLVAAPCRISDALNQYSCWESKHFYQHDYPGALEKTFVSGSNHVDLSDDRKSMAFKNFATDADIIHVHNQITYELAIWLRKNASRAKYIYHIHSPHREGPMYLDKWVDSGINFDKYLAVAQSYPRMYQDFIPVPNIVPWRAVEAPANEKGIIILYSPTHRREGRWGTKVSRELDMSLDRYGRLDGVKVISLDKPILPLDLFALRCRSNITIDEITTGGFHMVSLEGLVCGNVVINGADEFSIASFRGCTGDTSRPPFVHADPDNIADVLDRLIRDREYIFEMQSKSLDYAKKVLAPQKMIGRFLDVYEEVYN